MSDIPPENFYLYCVSSIEFEKRSLYKLGLTIHPVHRLRQYATGVPPSLVDSHLIYKALWKIGTKTGEQLHEMERILHTQFANRRDGTSEWFNVTPQEVIDFLLTPQKFTVEQISPDDVKDVNTKSKEPLDPSEEDAYDEEDALINEQEVIRKKAIRAKKVETLYEKFLRVFLPGKLPRRIQTELWDLFQEICRNPEHLSYRAIVQWPTGVGKTIATLMLIVIAAERCKARGEIYRGLFVSPKNDIIDTISKDFNKLSEFGITVYDGAHGKLSSLTIPTNCHIVISACQAALINDKGMRRLPNITHVHYDEVHRITGDLYFQLLKEMLVKWNTEFLTGTSATPKTCSKSQHDKLAELFGEPYAILHKCDVEDAVKEGWIAKPRYVVSITAKNDDRAVELDAFLVSIAKTIAQKKEAGHWKGGKVIAFSPDSVEDVRYLANHASEVIPGALIYSAIDGQRTDEAFIKAAADGTVRILFACQRFREGSDVKGLDMTCALVGNTTAVYILLQMCGRALRLDYEGKEGWCLIVRPSEEEATEDDVLASIILDIIEFLGDSKKKREVNKIEPLIKTFLGEVSVSGSSLTLEETIKRVQAAYIRREFTKRTSKEKYSLVREINKSLRLSSKLEYFARLSEHSKFIDDPKAYFEGCWNCWYDFLGVDTSAFPQTKSEWTRAWKDMGITSWSEYKEKNSANLPVDPGQMYEDYTNPIQEFGVEEEHEW